MMLIWILAFAMAWLSAQPAPTMHQSAAAVVTPGAPKADDYAGTAACVTCHKAKADTFLKTAHHFSSGPGTAETIKGSFAPDRNMLATSNPALSFRMESRSDGFYQTAITGTPPDVTIRSERIDMVTGSGRKGQTYLFRTDDRLWQLPISYWAESSRWTNSPGYRDGLANFDRPIFADCLECHATFLEARTPPANRFSRSGMILGIECEKCHGPGRAHIEQRRAGNSGMPAGTDVVNTGKAPRARQVDLCGLCHSGLRRAIQPAFSYRPGESLDAYSAPNASGGGMEVDVHGNQVALLERSRCFRASMSMTCSTCHDVHQVQRDVAQIANRCLSCHKLENCRVFPQAGQRIAGSCVDCHMPNQLTNAIAVAVNGESLRPSVRSHWIKIYPAESAAVLKRLVLQ